MKSPVFFTAMFLLLQCKSQQHAASSLPLENTRWKLVESGGKRISTPEGGMEVCMTENFEAVTNGNGN